MVSRLFSFTGWSSDHPRDQVPGDRLDSEFDRLNRALEVLEGQLGEIRRSDGSLQNEIVKKEAIAPSFYDQIVAFFKNQVKEDLSDARTARNVAENSATAAVIAKADAEGAAARAQSAATIAETGAGSLMEEVSATQAASRAVMEEAANTHASTYNAMLRSGDAEDMAALYADLSSLWAEYMPDTIPPNRLAVMDVTGDHWSSRWWANQAANAFGKMSELYLGAWPTPPVTTATGAPIPIGAVYYNTTTNQTYVWTGSQWVAFWRPQKSVTASLYYTLGAPATAIQVSTALDDFGNTFSFGDEGVEVYVGGPGSPGGLRLEPYAAAPTSFSTGGYWVDALTHSVMFTDASGAPLPAGTLVVLDFLASVDSLRPGSCALWPLRSFDTSPVDGSPGYQDGSRTVFVLARADSGSIAVESSEELMIYVNAVPQQPGIDYAVTGLTEVTFSEAPESDARTWALWMEPVGGAGSGTGGVLAPPDPPMDNWRDYFGWNPAGAGSAQWFDARGMVKVVLDEDARIALVNGTDIMDGSLCVQQDTRELWIYTGLEGWRLYYPALPTSGTAPATLHYDGTTPVWVPSGSAAVVSVGDSAPADPVIGQMWLETDSFALFVWYGSAWVQVNSLVAASAGTSVPGNTLLPGIAGSPVEGSVLTASTGMWTGSPTSYAYVWKRGGAAISGAVSSTYTLVTADVGSIITVTVTATNATGSTAATSAGTSSIAMAPPANSVLPAITGTATVGQTLSASTGTWSGSPSYTYQWKRGGTAISGATSATYPLVTADLGFVMTVTVTGTNAGGSTAATSTGTSAVASSGLILDGTSATGAWSMSRDLLTSFVGGTRYTTATGVNQINDQSGNTRHFANATTTAQPAVTTAGPLSRTCADFDGTSDFLATAGATSNLISVSSGYIVVSFIADAITSSTANIYDNNTVCADSGPYVGVFMKSPNILAAYNWDTAADSTTTTITTATPYVVEWRHEGGNVYLRVNGGSEVSVASGNTAFLTSALRIGLSGVSGAYGNVKFFEMATFSTVPSLATRDAIVANFKAWVGA